MAPGDPVVFRLHDRLTVGTLVSEAAQTVQVRLADGAVITRHRRKHAVGEVRAETSVRGR